MAEQSIIEIGPTTKSPQQRYLEQVVEEAPCKCGCGGIVERRRLHLMPSYIAKHGLREYLPRHNPKITAARSRGSETRAKQLRGKTGEQSPRWQGGRTVSPQGYVYVRNGDRYEAEHRVVAEGMLGRALLPSEHVHHRNGIKSDNAPPNLQVVSASEHTRAHNATRQRDARGRFVRGGTQ